MSKKVVRTSKPRKMSSPPSFSLDLGFRHFRFSIIQIWPIFPTRTSRTESVKEDWKMVVGRDYAGRWMGLTMYAPRLMLMYLGNMDDKSIPPETAFPAILIPN